jgi:hypothetical protein
LCPSFRFQPPSSASHLLRKQDADLVGVNERYVQDMKTIAREAPEKVEEIKAGKTNQPIKK